MIYRQLVEIQYLQRRVDKFREYLAQDLWNTGGRYFPCCKQLVPYDRLQSRETVQRINHYDEETDTMHYDKFCVLCRKNVKTTSVCGYTEKAQARDNSDPNAWDEWDDFIEADEYGEFLDPDFVLADICMIPVPSVLPYANPQTIRSELLYCAFCNVIENLQKDIERYIDYIDKTKSNNCKYCKTCDCLRYKKDNRIVLNSEECLEIQFTVKSGDIPCPSCNNILFKAPSYQPSGTVNMSRITGLIPLSFQPTGTINLS